MAKGTYERTKYHKEIVRRNLEPFWGKRKGAQVSNWKGDNASYRALHSWVVRALGKATRCSVNILHVAKRFDWANLSGEYKRDTNDYIQLCRSCHMRMDKVAEKRMRDKGKFLPKEVIV
jgi:hypothetical protein